MTSSDEPADLTPRAKQVLILARQEAENLGHNLIGTEHLLLGLIALGQGVATNILFHFGLHLDAARAEVEKEAGKGTPAPSSNPRYAPGIETVFAEAAKEAHALNHTYVGTEHILLGILSETEGVAFRILTHFGAKPEELRKQIRHELNPEFDKRNEAPGAGQVSKPPKDAIDTSRRYDVYCYEKGTQHVVYRNVLFKGRKSLFPRFPQEAFSGFLQLEQMDGSVVYVSQVSVVKFSPH